MRRSDTLPTPDYKVLSFRALTFRAGTAADCAAVRALQIESWQATYRGVFPDDMLDLRLPDAMAAKWAPDRLGPQHDLILAERDGIVLGFALIDYGAGSPLIDNLHVAPGATGEGIGARPIEKAADAIERRSETSAWLKVIIGNEGAQRFYERYAPRHVGVIEEEIWRACDVPCSGLGRSECGPARRAERPG